MSHAMMPSIDTDSERQRKILDHGDEFVQVMIMIKYFDPAHSLSSFLGAK